MEIPLAKRNEYQVVFLATKFPLDKIEDREPGYQRARGITESELIDKARSQSSTARKNIEDWLGWNKASKIGDERLSQDSYSNSYLVGGMMLSLIESETTVGAKDYQGRIIARRVQVICYHSLDSITQQQFLASLLGYLGKEDFEEKKFPKGSK